MLIIIYDVDCACIVNIFFPPVVGYIQLYGIPGVGGGGDLPL